jgi:hypothetical protein
LLVSNVGREHFTTPKRNNNRRRSGTSKRKSTVSGPSTEYQAATAENRAALSMMKAMKGPNNKYINTVKNAIQSTSITGATPYVQCLNGVSQGTGENSRIGRLCRLKWIDIDLDIYNTSTTDTVNMFRLYLVVETTALGSLLNAAQFFVDGSNWSPLSQRDRTNRNASRYVVLWDSKPFTLGSPVVTHGTTTVSVSGAGQPEERTFSMHIPLNFSTDYSRNNNGDITDIETNSLCIVAVCDQGSAAATLLGAYTLCFNDDS